jgi:hypothetical protein
MRGLFVFALFAHGLAHVVGFAGPWRLFDAEKVTYSNELLNGRLHVSDRSMRVIGIVWLALAVGFLVTGGAVALARPWWPSAAMTVGVASLVMCLVGWPASWIGAVVNVALIAILLLTGVWR